MLFSSSVKSFIVKQWDLILPKTGIAIHICLLLLVARSVSYRNLLLIKYLMPNKKSEKGAWCEMRDASKVSPNTLTIYDSTKHRIRKLSNSDTSIKIL